MAINPAPPPIRAKFLNPDGTVAVPWLQWFSQILGPTITAAVQASSSGDVTLGSGPDAPATINPKVVTLGKMADLPTHTIIGNSETAASGPEALTMDQVTALLNLFTTNLKGLVPASGGGSDNFLRADGVWSAPPIVGTAGGDLSGTYPNPTVAGVAGKVIPTLPSAGTTANLSYNGTTGAWVFDTAVYATQTWVNTNYLGITAQAADSAKLATTRL